MWRERQTLNPKPHDPKTLNRGVRGAGGERERVLLGTTNKLGLSEGVYPFQSHFFLFLEQHLKLRGPTVDLGHMMVVNAVSDVCDAKGNVLRHVCQSKNLSFKSCLSYSMPIDHC